MDITRFEQVQLVGIKGVAMTSLAQLLQDLDVTVTGSDVAETFVTQPLLDRLGVSVQTSFDQPLPVGTQAVVYTAAHGAGSNPQVQEARTRQLPSFSHAQALASLFNRQPGIAVCGVGGKSTISAMISWILTKLGVECSFSVGVGEIIGLGATGQWRPDAEVFVAEADEYVTEPAAVGPIGGVGAPAAAAATSTAAATDQTFASTPRFWLLEPRHIVCSHIKFDHPDVYRDFDDTLEVFGRFFEKLDSDGRLVLHGSNRPYLEQLANSLPNNVIWYGNGPADNYRLLSSSTGGGRNRGELALDLATPINPLAKTDQPRPGRGVGKLELELSIPGRFNLENAAAALAACQVLGLPADQVLAALKSFRSTKRRFEYLGTKHGVPYYDDYAHHPHQIAATITAFKNWLPDKQPVIAFQPHTYSRTRELFDDLVTALGTADHLLLLDIFASARELPRSDVSSAQLAAALSQAYPHHRVELLANIDDLAEYCRSKLSAGQAVMTMGAGDIYRLHQLL